MMLLVLQACNGLPESGVCDERTWLALLGADATPEDLDEVSQCDSLLLGHCHELILALLPNLRP
jgi:hypothetical protein